MKIDYVEMANKTERDLVDLAYQYDKLQRELKVIDGYIREVLIFLNKPSYEWTKLKIMQLKEQMERCLSRELSC